MKLVVYFRGLDDNRDPSCKEDIRNEILYFDDELGCNFSTNSTCMVCSERFNRYWVQSSRRGTEFENKIKFLKNKIISKNFYRRMKFDLDAEIELI